MMDVFDATCLIITCSEHTSKTEITELLHSDIIDIGTGFFVDAAGTLVTAAHVVQHEKNARQYAVINGTLAEFRVIKSLYGKERGDMYWDHAICKVPLRTQSFFALVPYIEPAENETLTLLGFSKTGLGEPRRIGLADSFLNFNQIPGRCFQPNAFIVGPGESYTNGFIMMFSDTFTDYPAGMSGGPIVNEQMEVKGLLSRGYTRNMGCQGLYLNNLYPFL